jgi:hypothetical protein
VTVSRGAHWTGGEQLRARRIVAVYDAIVRRGLAFHEAQPALARLPGARGRSPKRVGHNLLERLRGHKAAVLRFVFNGQIDAAFNGLTHQPAQGPSQRRMSFVTHSFGGKSVDILFPKLWMDVR